jgi:hypothetical protein
VVLKKLFFEKLTGHPKLWLHMMKKKLPKSFIQNKKFLEVPNRLGKCCEILKIFEIASFSKNLFVSIIINFILIPGPGDKIWSFL